jgi:electron transfer flavoprotein alpha subunit
MKALVPIELMDGRPSLDSLGVLERLAGQGLESWALVCGVSVEDVTQLVARYRCAGVLFAQGDAFATLALEPRAALIADLVEQRGFAVVAFATSVLATELAAQVAVRCDACVQWTLTAIECGGEHGLRGVRATHGDAMRTTATWDSAPAIALFRPHECSPGDPGAQAAPIEAVTPPAIDEAGQVIIELQPGAESGAAALDAADIIVSGGRGLRNADELALVRELADALGGAVGVSLPLVDMGWAPRAMQVGQTGTVVSPRLYIACGISGQIQHKIGIEKSGLIVAVNIDKDAPIMSFCDLGIVGDLRTLLPKLAAEVRAARAA